MPDLITASLALVFAAFLAGCLWEEWNRAS